MESHALCVCARDANRNMYSFTCAPADPRLPGWPCETIRTFLCASHFTSICFPFYLPQAAFHSIVLVPFWHKDGGNGVYAPIFPFAGPCKYTIWVNYLGLPNTRIHFEHILKDAIWLNGIHHGSHANHTIRVRRNICFGTHTFISFRSILPGLGGVRAILTMAF